MWLPRKMRESSALGIRTRTYPQRAPYLRTSAPRSPRAVTTAPRCADTGTPTTMSEGRFDLRRFCRFAPIRDRGDGREADAFPGSYRLSSAPAVNAAVAAALAAKVDRVSGGELLGASTSLC